MRSKSKSSNARKTSSQQMKHDVACVDLFCGAGGLTRGLLDATIPVVAGVDLDDACQHPYETNNDGAKFYSYDVAELKASEVQSWFGDAKVRVLAGCAPCQPFSSYAQRYETKGTTRWKLLNHFGRLVKEIKPDIVTMENVPTVIKHKVFDDFVLTLKNEGYAIWFNVVDISQYGLPQRRRRAVLLASRYGEICLNDPDKTPPKTVKDALKKLPPIKHGQSHKKDRLHIAASLSPLNFKRIKKSKPGGTWRDWPKELIAKCHRKESGRSYPGVYGRMVWDEPAPTLTTQFFGFGNGRFGHPKQDRALSLREGAILQGFPKNYSFLADDKPIMFRELGRLIGNAVPVELGRVIGNSILNHLNHVDGLLSVPPMQSRRRIGHGEKASKKDGI